MATQILDRLYSLTAPERTRPADRQMQVLCLGLSRSGTDSLRNALVMLGYRDVYHGFVITASQRSDCAFWVPLMRQKLSASRSTLVSADFDKVLGSCEAITDGPANVFGTELLDYYPKARVVLNRRRDDDAWYRSMQQSCLQVFSWPMWVISWFDRRVFWLWRNFEMVMMQYYDGDFARHGKRVAREHYSRLEEDLQSRNREYLKWSVEDGWEPLCSFLGKPVPDAPFPSGNQKGGQFEQNMEAATKDLVQNAFVNMGLFTATLTAVGAAVVYRFR